MDVKRIYGRSWILCQTSLAGNGLLVKDLGVFGSRRHQNRKDVLRCIFYDGSAKLGRMALHRSSNLVPAFSYKRPTALNFLGTHQIDKISYSTTPLVSAAMLAYITKKCYNAYAGMRLPLRNYSMFTWLSASKMHKEPLVESCSQSPSRRFSHGPPLEGSRPLWGHPWRLDSPNHD